MPRFKNINGVRSQFTAEEETLRDAEEAQAVIDHKRWADEAAQKIVDRQTGNQKLLDLGLTQAEVNVIRGHPPD